MKTCIGIAIEYIRYYKNKSISVLFSIILAVSLIVGIGTLFNSAKHANVEKVRNETGDYHYYFSVNPEQYETIKHDSSIEKIAVSSYYDSAQEPNRMNIIHMDKNYIELSNSQILKGKMPTESGEIALEEWVLRNLNVNAVIGEKITIALVNSNNSETFILTGILKDFPLKKAEDEMNGYIRLNENAEELKVYLKFNEHLDIRKSLNQLLKKIDNGDNPIYVNRDLLDALNIATYIPPIGTKGSIRFIIEHYHLDLVGIIFIICLFSAFVIYSVFQISILQRVSEYGLLRALGAESSKIFTILVSELVMLFLIGFPIGVLNGYLGAQLLSPKFSSVLIGQEVHFSQIILSTKSILVGGLFLILLLILIANRVLKTLNKLTPMEAIQKKYSHHVKQSKSKKQYTLKNSQVTNAISHKYMTRNKATLASILISLSLGGAIFICSSYASNLKMQNNVLSIKADCDLNSDYQIHMQATDFDNGITDEHLSELMTIKSIARISPIQYYFGSLIINDDKMLSKSVWEAYNNDPYFKDSFGGMYTKINDNSNQYLLRTGIYGYDDHMLNVLKDYVLEGEINVSKMKQDNLILFKQIQDGGNGLYDLIDVKPGDTICVKYQKSPKISNEALRFEQGPTYIERTYVVGATLKRVAASNSNFIGDAGEDIIMTNEQFQRDFGIDVYNMVSITVAESADHIRIADEIQSVVKEVPLCSVRDLTIEIARNNAFVHKQLLFLYGITIILFIISLFNILNNISYNVLSRMNEFGVLRAIGVTDHGIWWMILREGFLYGLFSSILTVLFSLLGQVVILYTGKIAYLYINPKFTIQFEQYVIIIILNILIALIATIIPSRKIIWLSIIEEIKKQE